MGPNLLRVELGRESKASHMSVNSPMTLNLSDLPFILKRLIRLCFDGKAHNQVKSFCNAAKQFKSL
jgi:hypothetical protein